MTSNKKISIRTIAVFFLLLIIFSIGYLTLLETVVPHSGLEFVSGWEETTFTTTSNESLTWSDENFEKGWKAAWLYDQSSSGFEASNDTLVLGATFNGFNNNDIDGIGGIIVKKDINKLNTSISPFLVIKHFESSSNPALMFSFGITDVTGQWYAGGPYKVSTSLSTLNYDLRLLHNGTIKSISIMFTNSFDSNSEAGVQFAYIQSIAIYEEQPEWWLASSLQTPAGITSQNGILKLSGIGHLTKGTIISAQRSKNLTFNLIPYNYLNISIRTSSLNTAARIVIWPDPIASHSREVLLKTYNDNNWHTEIVELTLFGLTQQIHRIELGLVNLNTSIVEEWVNYKELSFNYWQVSP